MNKAAMIFPGYIGDDLMKELSPNILFYNAVLEEAVEVALKCEKDGVDVIISRAGSAAAIKKVVKVPVVNCEVTHSDLIDSILNIKTKHYPNLSEIGLINYANVSYDVNHIEQLTNIKVKQSWFWKGAEDLKERIIEYKESGVKVVMGASMTVRFAEEIGISGFLMQVGQETLQQAMQKAKEILAIRKADLAYSEKIKNMLSVAHEGILFIDEDNKIEYVNPKALSMLGKASEYLEGQKAANVFGGWEEEDSKIKLNQITKAFDNQVIYSRAPVMVRDKKVGEVVTFTETAQIQNVEEKIRNFFHNKGFVSKHKLSDIVGESTAIKEVVEKTRIYGKADATVLIIGETGTGKELVAHSLHQESQRRNNPFLAINCAALPENLLESELFGYTEGAFTGAKKGGRAGYFELAHRGTLFLDEIGELRPQMQGKLLRAIQEKEIMRIGDDKIIPVDTRIIAATNQNLFELVNKKEFRSDLFYRLNVLKIQLPPLKDRKEDISHLIKHFANKFYAGKKNAEVSISGKLMKTICEYDWPGNIRELECLMNRYFLLADVLGDNAIVDEFRDADINKFSDSSDPFELVINAGTMEEMQDEIYAKIYELTKQNKTQTAKILGVNRVTVAKWLEKMKK